MSFHEIRFPIAISLGAIGGPERRTDVVALASGFEERNSRWADSRRSYDVGYGARNADDIHAIVAFFEERRGKLYGFRFKDHADFKSCPPLAAISALDQAIGSGTGSQAGFQLRKSYGVVHAPFERVIRKPVAGTVQIAVDGLPMVAGIDFTVDGTTGLVTFLPGNEPAEGTAITAGFEYDVPVRFDTDKLEINLHSLTHGSIPHIPIVEVRL